MTALTITATGGVTCPLCGKRAPVWLDAPPTGCLQGNAPTRCQEAMDDAYGAAMRRKVCPEAFDANGKILPGGIVRVTKAMHDAGLNMMTGRPL